MTGRNSLSDIEIPQTRYRLSVPFRLLVIILVVIAAILTTLGVLPLAYLMGVEPSRLQGAGFEPTFKTMTIGIIYSASQFLLIWLVIRFVHRRRFSDLGFRGQIFRPIFIGMAIGLVIKFADIGLLCIASSNIQLKTNIPEASLASVVGYFLLWLLFLLTLNSLKEELVFRAYPIEQFNDHPRAIVWVLVFVSVVFAAVHHVIEPFTLSAFISRFSIAMLFSYVYFRWRSIWLVVGIHNGSNLLSFMLGGHWKAGGLLHLTYDPPNPAIDIIIDTSVKFLVLGMIHLYWQCKGRIKG